MKVFDDACDHFHDTSGLFFGEKLLLEYLVEELATFHQFGYQVDMLRIFEGIAQRYDIWVLTVTKKDFDLLAAISLTLFNYLNKENNTENSK